MNENKHTPEPWNNQKYIERFWSRVDVKGPDECWEWKRGSTVQGYGCFHYGSSSIRAHRFSYQQHNGPIKEHDCVCHSCDNPKCVNPAHLWIGTRAENNADKEAKKRGVHPVQSSGESNTNYVLTTPEVIAARVMSRKGLPQARIAKLLDVSTSAVCLIVNGERRVDETERRVSACVNACAGIPTSRLEAGAADILAYSMELKKQRDELLSDLAEAKRSAEFNFEQYQDVGRLLHEECEKTEKLLAAMIHIQQVACSGSPELGIAIDAIASVKGKQ